MTHSLYIDESGDPGPYVKDRPKYKNSSAFFTLAGIIVPDADVGEVEKQIQSVIKKYLKPKVLAPDFKLHYHDLIQGASQYSIISGESRLRLADDIFNIIIQSPCTLLSVTLDLDAHYKQYIEPAHPKEYTMLMMLERFQDFLVDEKSTGSVIYERFTHADRARVQRGMRMLRWALSRRHHVELNNILGNIKSGEPADHPILQLADFFAYAVQIKAVSNNEKQNRWKSIKSKYFRLDGSFYSTGYVVR